MQILRGRLQDIRQHLHCQLPVYVVLTRLWIYLHGFTAALFQSLDRNVATPFLASPHTRHAHEGDDWHCRTECLLAGMGRTVEVTPLPERMVALSRGSLFALSRPRLRGREPLIALLNGLLDEENIWM